MKSNLMDAEVWTDAESSTDIDVDTDSVPMCDCDCDCTSAAMWSIRAHVCPDRHPSMLRCNVCYKGLLRNVKRILRRCGSVRCGGCGYVATSVQGWIPRAAKL